MYAVISDIHGNLEALQAVLADLPEEVETVYCLGDVIGYGASPEECCELVRERGMPLITGNHDLAVVDLDTDLNWFNPVAAAAVLWTRENLSRESADFLRARPCTMQSGGILFVHGSPRDPDEYIVSSEVAEENLEFLEGEHPGVRVCFFGHTHVKVVAPPPEEKVSEESPSLDLGGGGPYLINPGSVGQPRDGDIHASYVLVEPDDSGETSGPLVTYRLVGYDMQKAQDKIRDAGLPRVLADRLGPGTLVEPSFEKLFTVEEANALLPTLQNMLGDVAVHRDALREKAPDVEPIVEAAAANGGGKVGSEYGVEAYRLYRAIQRIQELGVILEDLDMGLLDFPHERDGRVVLLCWHPPEERVMYWHDIEAGYQGRQPL